MATCMYVCMCMCMCQPIKNMQLTLNTTANKSQSYKTISTSNMYIPYDIYNIIYIIHNRSNMDNWKMKKVWNNYMRHNYGEKHLPNNDNC